MKTRPCGGPPTGRTWGPVSHVGSWLVAGLTARVVALLLATLVALAGTHPAAAQSPAADEPLPHQGAPLAPGEDVSNSPERFLKVCFDWPYWKVSGKKW